MKKWIKKTLYLSTGALGVAFIVTPNIASTAKIVQISEKKENTNTPWSKIQEVNIKAVGEQLSNYFPTANHNSIEQKMFNFAQNKAKMFLHQMGNSQMVNLKNMAKINDEEKNNYISHHPMARLSTKSVDLFNAKIDLHNVLSNKEANAIANAKKQISPKNYYQAKKWNSSYWNKMNILDNALSTTAAVAAVAAAAFWAAAWFFGFSVPWAIAASAIAAVLSVAAAGLGTYINNYHRSSSWINAVYWALQIKGIASTFKEVLYPLLVVSETVTSIDEWVLPGVGAVISVILVVVGWVLYP